MQWVYYFKYSVEIILRENDVCVYETVTKDSSIAKAEKPYQERSDFGMWNFYDIIVNIASLRGHDDNRIYKFIIYVIRKFSGVILIFTSDVGQSRSYQFSITAVSDKFYRCFEFLASWTLARITNITSHPLYAIKYKTLINLLLP